MKKVMFMDSELIAVEQSTAPQSIDLIKNQAVIQSENTQAMLVVQEVMNNKPNPVMIRGKRHFEYEDWIALGNAFGLDVATGDAEPVEIFEAKGFKAKAKLIRVADGVVIGGAEAYCLDNEENWLNKDYYQMASMAQTRAGSKALSNALRGVVSLVKSLSGTPAEEMQHTNEPKKQPFKKPPAPKNTAPTKKAPAPKPKEEPIETKAEVVEAEVVTEETEKPKKKSMTIKELMDNNQHINKAVHALQDQEINVSRATISEKLMDLWDMGKIEKADYDVAINELKQ